MVEHGRTTESSAWRGYQRLEMTDDPLADPTIAYPGETPSLLKKAAKLAGDHGMTLMGSRLYNPATGRFASTDPLPDGNPNAYIYPTDPING